jgi:dienelactone hydrolase
MKRIAATFALLLASAPALAAMQARPVEWTLDGATFQGVLVYDDAGAKRPGLVMVPDWKGVTDNAIAKARHVAGDDYVVLVADVYGKGVRPRDDAEAMAQVKKLYADRGTLRARAAKALEVLKAQADSAPLDPAKLGAIGYCFGGATVLELARAGADLAAVVTFHGGLNTDMPAKPGAVKASLLVLNGADDKGTAGDVAGFQQEMDVAGADWTFVDFGGAVHCFTQPESNDPPNCVYDERSAKRAFRMMADFFRERFAAG